MLARESAPLSAFRAKPTLQSKSARVLCLQITQSRHFGGLKGSIFLLLLRLEAG